MPSVWACFCCFVLLVCLFCHVCVVFSCYIDVEKTSAGHSASLTFIVIFMFLYGYH